MIQRPGATTTEPQAITGARVLTPDGWLDDGCVVWRNGVIEEVRAGSAPAGVTALDATGATLLPGIVDIHGDAFERHITPRAGVHFDVAMGLHSNDGALIASGITTFFYSITDGFEPGPRSRDTTRRTLEHLEASRPRLRADTRVHIRHEVVATEGFDELLGWLRDGRVGLLSINDHLPPLDNPDKRARYLYGLDRRVSMTEAEKEAFLARLQASRPVGAAQVGDLAEAARRAGVPLASHDDATPADLERSLALGVAIAEFPMTMDMAHAFRARGVHVLMGAPNLVRGGSHVSGVSVREALAEGAVDCLCSDYHYPSLFRAPFLLEHLGIMDLARGWSLVSGAPAHAAGLGGRKGAIAPGADADLLLVEVPDGLVSGLVGTIVGGKWVLRRF
jgi:alpha-D-ribose 1-methylphosphonate 5-triphosphate diphosphatase